MNAMTSGMPDTASLLSDVMNARFLKPAVVGGLVAGRMVSTSNNALASSTSLVGISDGPHDVCALMTNKAVMSWGSTSSKHHGNGGAGTPSSSKSSAPDVRPIYPM